MKALRQESEMKRKVEVHAVQAPLTRNPRHYPLQEEEVVWGLEHNAGVKCRGVLFIHGLPECPLRRRRRLPQDSVVLAHLHHRGTEQIRHRDRDLQSR